MSVNQIEKTSGPNQFVEKPEIIEKIEIPEKEKVERKTETLNEIIKPIEIEKTPEKQQEKVENTIISKVEELKENKTAEIITSTSQSINKKTETAELLKNNSQSGVKINITHEKKNVEKMPETANNNLNSKVFQTIPHSEKNNHSHQIETFNNVYNQSDVEEVPVLKNKIKPEYPFAARQMKIEGFVKLEFIVTSEGKVKDIKIIESIPKNIFNKSALDAANQWRFNPAKFKGSEVDCKCVIKIDFKIQ